MGQGLIGSAKATHAIREIWDPRKNSPKMENGTSDNRLTARGTKGGAYYGTDVSYEAAIMGFGLGHGYREMRATSASSMSRTIAILDRPSLFYYNVLQCIK